MITKKILLTILVSILFLVSLKVFFGLYAADYFYKRAQVLIEDGFYSKAEKYADYAIRLNPREANYYRGRAKVLLALLSAEEVGKVGDSYNGAEKTHDLKLKILNDLGTAYNLNPNNLVVMRNSISIYYLIAVKDLALPAGSRNVDDRFIGYAGEFYKMLKERYPNDLGVLTDIAKYEKRLGLVDEYNETIERIRFLRPDILARAYASLVGSNGPVSKYSSLIGCGQSRG